MDKQGFLSVVADLIVSNYPEDEQRGLRASEVGLLVRHALPETNWSEFGLPKLKDILVELERQGRIRTGVDAKFAYTVWLGEEKVRERSDRPLLPPQSNLRRFRSLRKAIWTAFVADRPHGRRFLNRIDGTVRMGLLEVPSPASEWVGINPVPQDTQRSWAREFLAQCQLSEHNELLATLETDLWYRDFVQKLRELRQDDAGLWLRLRSERIIEHVHEWIEKNGVPQDHVFEAQEAPKRSVHVRGIGKYPDLREGLIAAVESLTTDELLQLRIPARKLLTVFRPDLIDSGVKSCRQS